MFCDLVEFGVKILLTYVLFSSVDESFIVDRIGSLWKAKK